MPGQAPTDSGSIQPVSFVGSPRNDRDVADDGVGLGAELGRPDALAAQHERLDGRIDGRSGGRRCRGPRRRWTWSRWKSSWWQCSSTWCGGGCGGCRRGARRRRRRQRRELRSWWNRRRRSRRTRRLRGSATAPSGETRTGRFMRGQSGRAAIGSIDGMSNSQPRRIGAATPVSMNHSVPNAWRKRSTGISRKNDVSVTWLR